MFIILNLNFKFDELAMHQQEKMKAEESTLSAAVDQYAANQRTLMASAPWIDAKAAGTRVARARQKADSSKEALIIRCVFFVGERYWKMKIGIC